MSSLPEQRRGTFRLAMTPEQARDVLSAGFYGQLATVGADGYPYCVPLLYVWMDDEIHFHTTRARGHLRANVEHQSRVCFGLAEAGEIFPYGRFECDTSIAYRSVVAFGTVRVVEDAAAKQRFFERLMAKYGKPGWRRPEDFFPRIGQITLYALAVERLTGKHIALPEVSAQWPALDRTVTPNARP